MKILILSLSILFVSLCIPVGALAANSTDGSPTSSECLNSNGSLIPPGLVDGGGEEGAIPRACDAPAPSCPESHPNATCFFDETTICCEKQSGFDATDCNSPQLILFALETDLCIMF